MYKAALFTLSIASSIVADDTPHIVATYEPPKTCIEMISLPPTNTLEMTEAEEQCSTYLPQCNCSTDAQKLACGLCASACVVGSCIIIAPLFGIKCLTLANGFHL